jgi:hypothetical protein
MSLAFASGKLCAFLGHAALARHIKRISVSAGLSSAAGEGTRANQGHP